MGIARKCTDDEVDTALTMYIVCGRRQDLAIERLKERGLEISVQTFSQWVNKFPDRIERIRLNAPPELYARIAADCDELANKYGRIEKLAADRVIDQIPTMEPKELASILGKVPTAKGINIDKSRLLRDRPTQIVEHRDVTAALERLEQLGVWVEGTATEVSSHEPVEGVAAVPAISAG